MKLRLRKIIPLAVFGLVMAFIGSVLVGNAYAVTSPLVCGGEEVGGVSGWLLCRLGAYGDLPAVNTIFGIIGKSTDVAGTATLFGRIGLSTDGISGGGDSLFRGQRILGQKLDALSLSGQDQYVYLEKGDAAPGSDRYVRLGKLQTAPVIAGFAGVAPLDYEDQGPNGTSARFDIFGGSGNTNPRAYFIPIPNVLVATYAKVRGGVTINPTLCEVSMNLATSVGFIASEANPDGIINVKNIGIQCTYQPGLCERSSAGNGCLLPPERVVWSQNYNSAGTPKSQQYRIIIQ